MRQGRKVEQLQIRVSSSQKREMQRRAKAAGVSVSSWVLERALPARAMVFDRLAQQLSVSEDPSFVLAELNDFLAALPASEFASALAVAPPRRIAPWLRAYLAAMVEHAAAQKRAPVPRWADEVGPLDQPYFASQLLGLRMHLLASSPAAFRRRNLFVDASIGDRI